MEKEGELSYIRDLADLARLPQIFQNSEKVDYEETEDGLSVPKAFRQSFKVKNPDSPTDIGVMTVSCSQGQLRPSDELILLTLFNLFAINGVLDKGSRENWIETSISEIKAMGNLGHGGRQYTSIYESLVKICSVNVSMLFDNSVSEDENTSTSFGFFSHDFTKDNLTGKHKIYMDGVLLEKFRNEKIYLLDYVTLKALPKGATRKLFKYLSSYFKTKDEIELSLDYVIESIMGLKNDRKSIYNLKKVILSFEIRKILAPSKVLMDDNGVKDSDVIDIFFEKNNEKHVLFRKGSIFDTDLNDISLPKTNTSTKSDLYNLLVTKIGVETYFTEFILDLAYGEVSKAIKEKKKDKLFENVMEVVGKGECKITNEVREESYIISGFDDKYLKKFVEFSLLYFELNEYGASIGNKGAWFRTQYLNKKQFSEDKLKALKDLKIKREEEKKIKDKTGELVSRKLAEAEMRKKKEEQEIKEALKQKDVVEEIINKNLSPDNEKIHGEIRKCIFNKQEYDMYYKRSRLISFENKIYLVYHNAFVYTTGQANFRNRLTEVFKEFNVEDCLHPKMLYEKVHTTATDTSVVVEDMTVNKEEDKYKDIKVIIENLSTLNQSELDNFHDVLIMNLGQREALGFVRQNYRNPVWFKEEEGKEYISSKKELFFKVYDEFKKAE